MNIKSLFYQSVILYIISIGSVFSQEIAEPINMNFDQELSAKTVFQLSVGFTHATLADNGVWWQQEYANTLSHNVPTMTLRADMELSSTSSIGIGYTYIGHFHSYALAKASDQAYNNNKPYPLSTWIGDETMQGIFLAYRKKYGNWYIEGGPMLTYANWTMTIPDWRGCSDWPEPCYIAKPAEYVQKEVKQFMIGVRFGAGYRYDDHWSIDYSFVPTHIFNEFPGITSGMSHALSIGYTF